MEKFSIAAVAKRPDRFQMIPRNPSPIRSSAVFAVSGNHILLDTPPSPLLYSPPLEGTVDQQLNGSK